MYKIKSGEKYTLDKIFQIGLIQSPEIIGGIFKIVPRLDLSASSTGVINTGTTDTSRVYQIKEVSPDTKAFTAEYSASQTATSIIAAPGVGKRIVITYGSVRTVANTGEAVLNAGTVAYFKAYFSVQASFAAANVNLPIAENTAITLTSTQGAQKLFVAVEYHIEDV